ncbi:hypothetical protein RD110_20005 [Rhodoferax koreense]|uniref:Uncharacterized protein n=1 Tax=Rhodoferax koreensis TaxID=1842727 RepID=A0A1P8JZN6_9BURK|nr:hypothetical protein [Rhodoferax koreense]APW39216.1 hypothetical protein RD110_20005 [Rhodoferax koreense]
MGAEASTSAAGTDAAVPALTRLHTRRLREIYRSAGWPCQDMLEVELLAAGLVKRCLTPSGHTVLQVTDAGIAVLAQTLAGNRAVRSDHEALVERVAREMQRAGRIAWRGLSLRAQLPGPDPATPGRWCIAQPDVFSIRNTTVEAYTEPVVHEIKVRRADLLGDLRQPMKRAAYLDLGGECWYVLGSDKKGRCIGAPDEVPVECGVLLLEQNRLHVARKAPRRAITRLPFGLWMALAKATPMAGLDEDNQALLGEPTAPEN